MIIQFLKSRYFLWLLLALPVAWMLTGYLSGRLYYGEVVHASGEWAVRLMMLAMAATPLLLMFPGRPVPRWLMRHRRSFGVAAFAYALVHTLVYMSRTEGLAEIMAEGAESPYLTGWVAMLAFTLLALTSNNTSVRLMGELWRRLHRLVYLAALLTFAHWVLVAFDPLAAWVHAGALAVLEGIRIVLRRRIRGQAPMSP